MSETRKRTLEKSDSIPTEEIILGPQDENTEKTENIEGKASGVKCYASFRWSFVFGRILSFNIGSVGKNAHDFLAHQFTGEGLTVTPWGFFLNAL